MWTHVKFIFDNQLVHTPIEFFKDSVNVERELRDGNKRDTYFTFWSPKDSDTPESVAKEQEREECLVIDNINKRELDKLKAKYPKGIPGYYKSELMQWEGEYTLISLYYFLKYFLAALNFV